MTVRETLTLYARIRSVASSDIPECIESLCKFLCLDSFIDSKSGRLRFFLIFACLSLLIDFSFLYHVDNHLKSFMYKFKVSSLKDAPRPLKKRKKNSIERAVI